MISGKGGFTRRAFLSPGVKEGEKDRGKGGVKKRGADSGEEKKREREGNVPVQKLTNEGREYPERCIQVKRGKRNRPHKKERWNGRYV